MNLKLRNRIAFFYITATAALTALLFIIIYSVVRSSVYSRIDDKLFKESEEVGRGIYVGEDSIKLINLYEWEEREHSQIEINPTFIEIVDRNNILIRKSDNLHNNNLEFQPAIKEQTYFNSKLSNNSLRLLQLPLENPAGKTIGYMIIGLPLDEGIAVLNQLGWVLISGYLGALFLLFLIARWIAEKSIIPIHNVTLTAEKITRENLSERIKLPGNKDEIYLLAKTVNGVLDRLEDAMLREKQFTSDASHELRTPLSVIKGTLEVLIRKKRTAEQYEEKISYCINEVNRMNNIIDQLLLLARFESGNIEPIRREVNLNDIVMYTLLRTEQKAKEKGISVNFKEGKNFPIIADPSMLEVILENLLSNSIKYSNGSKNIDIKISCEKTITKCVIKDYGIGMEKEELARVFDRFFRSEKARNTNNNGDGIGLAIVKKLADLQDINISISSEPGKGTEVSLCFKS